MGTQFRRAGAFGVAIALTLVASGWLLTAQQPQAAGTWAPAGVLASSVVGTASAVLSDGRTVFVGGVVDGAPTRTIFVYDPTTNSRIVAGEMTSARVGHTATVLDDGRVLIVGGRIGGEVTADLEIFSPDADPLASRSALVGTMLVAREGHAAATLADGTVLIVGGANGSGPLRSAEIFNPANDTTVETWHPLGTARAGASATRLIDGRVLVAGGTGRDEAGNIGDLASAELYEPAMQAFEPASTQMSAPRSGHTAVLLPDNNSVLLAGGSSNGAPVASADLFLPAEFPDPYTWFMGSFALTSPMAAPRHSAVGGPKGDDGLAYVVGGGSATIEQYRFATIKTDKNDYAPGEFAVITGSGWQPGEIVTLRFQEDPAVHEDYVLTVRADAGGNVYWDQWAPEGHDLGVTFYLTASDSRSRAQTVFTDANVNVTPQLFPSSGYVSISAGTFHDFAATASRGGPPQDPNPILTGSFVAGTGNPSCGTSPDRAISPGWISVLSAPVTVANSKELTIRVSVPAGQAPGNYRARFRLAVEDGSSNTNLDFCVTVPALATTSVMAASANATYGDSVASLTATVNPSTVNAGTVSFAVKSGSTTIGTVTSGTVSGGVATASFPLAGLNAGGYTVEAAYSGASGFGASNNAGQNPVPTLTVNKAQSSTIVTCSAGPFTYNGNAQTPCSAAVTGAGGLSEAVAVVHSNHTDAGTATATATYAESANHLGSTDSKTFTIDKAMVTATAGGGSSTFDGSAKSPAACVVSGLYTGDLSCTNDPSTVGPDAGTTTIAPMVSGTTLENFAITAVGGSYTIDRASSTTVITCPASVTYNGTAQTPCSVSVTGAGGLNLTPDADYSDNTNAGTANASYTYAGGTNHDGSSDSRDFDILKATVTVTPDSGQSKVYGTTDPVYAYTHSALAGSDTAALFSGALDRAPGENAGLYEITLGTLSAGGNYTLVVSSPAVRFEITRASVTVTPDSGQSKRYGTVDPTLTYTHTPLAGGDGPSVFTGALGRAAGEDAGTYEITLGTLSAGNNYNTMLSTTRVTFEVTKAPASVTPSAASKIYGDADPPLSGTLSGFLGSDNVTATYSRTAGETVTGGPYTIGATLSPADRLANYDVTYNTAAFDILQRAASVTPNAAGKTYGDTDPVLGGTLAGFLGRDSVTATYSRTPGETVLGGPYSINAVLSPEAVLGNYKITYDTALFTITTRAATWSTHNASKVFDEPDPVPLTTGTGNGFLPSDGVSATYSRAGGEAVGSYGITATLAASVAGALTNYAITNPGATFTIGAWDASGSGFYSPVSNSVFAAAPGVAPVSTVVWNTVKGGSTVPLKFNVFAGGVERTLTGDVKFFTQMAVSCGGGAIDDVVEETLLTSGSTALRYDAVERQFVQNWKTPSVRAETCYRATVTFKDGSSLSAFFKLRK